MTRLSSFLLRLTFLGSTSDLAVSLKAAAADGGDFIPVQITHAQNLIRFITGRQKLVFISMISGKEQLFTGPRRLQHHPAYPDDADHESRVVTGRDSMASFHPH